jgi:CubicO group peptidase (beta-lactamase class C family)
MEDVIMKNTKIIAGLFFALALSTMAVSCLLEDIIKVSFQTYVPPDIGDGWTISSPAAKNIDADKLEDVYRYVHESDDIWQIRSLLVFRDGALVAESYMKDRNDRTHPGAIWSCTKQFTAILTGIAVDQSLVAIDDPISDYIPQALTGRPDKSGITIRNLLMMKSGIDFNNDGFNGETSKLLRGKPSNSLDFILGLSMVNTPGARFNYNDGDPHIVSAILQAKTGKSLRVWAREVLFDKIGINNLEWITYKDGLTMGSFGILTTPREMAKLGQLVLNGGMWNSEQIVLTAWINAMTSAQAGPGETGESGIGFGYFWWVDTGRGLSIMRGHGGQYVFLNNIKSLMVVITSEPNTQGDFQLSLNQGLSIYDRITAIAN